MFSNDGNISFIGFSSKIVLEMERINGVLHLVVSELELSRFCTQNFMYIAQRQLLTLSIVWLTFVFLSL